MANEIIWKYGSQVTLQTSGASAASNAFVSALTATMNSANHANYPMVDLALTCAFFSPVNAGSTVNVYRQDLGIDGANNAPTPSGTIKNLYVGAFLIPSAQSASATYPLTEIPVSSNCVFYIENASNQNLLAGWVLKATPKTYVPAP